LTSPHRNYVSLQAGRGIAALLIVLHHTSTFVGGEPHLWHHPAIARWMMGMQLGVDFFFVLSGVVILTAHWDDINRPRTVATYLYKRFRRIYPIYWIVLIALLLRQFTHLDGASAVDRNPFVVLSSFLLVHIHSSKTNLIVAWTLFHEVLFYAVFATALLSKRLGTIVFALWFALSIVSLFRADMPFPKFISPLHLLFALGMAAAWFLHQHTVPKPALFLAAGAVLFASALLYYGWLGAVVSPTSFVAGIGATLMLLGSAELERQHRIHVPRALAFLGNASYSIYLIHYPIIAAAAHLGFHLDARLHLPIPFWMITLAAIGTTAGCLLYLCIERPLLKWLGKPITASAA